MNTIKSKYAQIEKDYEQNIVTIKMDNDIIKFDRDFVKDNTVAYTNKDSFAIVDYDTNFMKHQKLQTTEILFSHFLFNPKTNKLTDLLSLQISALDGEFITNSNSDNSNSNSFVKVFNKETKNKKIEIISFKNGKKVITANGTPLIETMDNKLIRINFTKTKEIPTSFLYHDKDLEEANLPKTEKISDFAFMSNINMKILNVPKVKHIGNYVLYNNKELKNVYLPSANDVGSNFLDKNDNKNLFMSGKIKNINNILFKIYGKTK